MLGQGVAGETPVATFVPLEDSSTAVARREFDEWPASTPCNTPCPVIDLVRIDPGPESGDPVSPGIQSRPEADATLNRNRFLIRGRLAMRSPSVRRVALVLIVGAASMAVAIDSRQLAAGDLAAAPSANRATIHRDQWGVAHIDGPTDAEVVFALAYAQAEDYFWQIEDTYLQALGRYAEVVGESGLSSDLTNHTFEVAARARDDFQNLDPQLRAIAEAYAAGLNLFLAKHPQLQPRLLTRWEPWFVLAYERHVMLDRLYGKAHIARPSQQPLAAELEASTGSNAWAIGPSKTRNGTAMLFVNPHQPWFGSGQFWEVHVRSGEGWNFSGSTFFGGPFPTMGHNEHLGWAHTVNEPDTTDIYRLTFDNPARPLDYRYGDGYRTCTEWGDTIRVKTASGIESRTYRFRKSHYGPIVKQEDPQHALAVRIAKLFDGSRMRQALRMTKAQSMDQWMAAMASLDLQMFNTVYADDAGNIAYIYNGAVPERDPQFDWQHPVDGANPAAEWHGIHALDELPQLINPAGGYVQNCNSTPFTTADDGSPFLQDFPSYMVEEKYDDKRRAKVSRLLLRQSHDMTFEDWQRLCFDTTLYWPLTEVPRLARRLPELRRDEPELAERVAPYFEHLQSWDCRGGVDSTQATLCVQWYEELYGRGYPVEQLRPRYRDEPLQMFAALVAAADKLQQSFGDWRVPWGRINRLQRPPQVANALQSPFTDTAASLPCAGLPGPLGVAFTVYYTPTTEQRKLRYGTTGGSFIGVYEFGKPVRAATLLQFGVSGDPESPHYFDQAQLYSRSECKPAWFAWDEVLANAQRSYRPGEEIDR